MPDAVQYRLGLGRFAGHTAKPPMDSTGFVQPRYGPLRAVRGTRSTYHNNAIQSWRVAGTGEVFNLHVDLMPRGGDRASRAVTGGHGYGARPRRLRHRPGG